MNSLFNIPVRAFVLGTLAIGGALGTLGTLPRAEAASLSPKEIMAQNESVRQLDDVSAHARLVQSTSGSESKTKVFRWLRKLSANKKDYRTFVRFEAPATVRDEGILILENEGSSNEVLLYLPAYKKIRRVENQQQNAKFMGSEFSYADMATPHLSDYAYSGGKIENCPGAAPAAKCYVIEATPALSSVSERTGYSKIINWIRTDNFMLAEGHYFDSQGKLLKRFENLETAPAAKAPGKWIAKRSKMTHLPSGNTTVIELDELKVNDGIADAQFTQQNLSRTN